ncbi:hypothetical protein TNCV_2654521 [Trichonephila clavipes]|nr:hypothetical protein TNCV_2654521 [Trichonephila clavipes]
MFSHPSICEGWTGHSISTHLVIQSHDQVTGMTPEMWYCIFQASTTLQPIGGWAVPQPFSLELKSPVSFPICFLNPPGRASFMLPTIPDWKEHGFSVLVPTTIGSSATRVYED